MPRQSTLLVLLLAAACADTPTSSPPTAPGPAADPAPPSLALIPNLGYQAAALPLEWGAAINAAGDVVGTENGKGIYWEYKTGTSTALAVPGTVTHVTPVDVVDDGRILARGNGMQGPKALYYPSRTAAAIDVAAGNWAEPSAMNDAGVAVGRYGSERGWGGWRWTPDGGLVNITPPGVDLAWPTDISEKGYVVGWTQIGNAVTGYRWEPSGAPGVALPAQLGILQALDGGGALVTDPAIGSAVWTVSSLTGVGPDPLRYHVARVSPLGRLVGSFTDPNTRAKRAWTSYKGGPITLPLPPGFADAWSIDVNACGSVLGRGTLAGTTTVRAILWTRSLTCDIGPVSNAP